MRILNRPLLLLGTPLLAVACNPEPMGAPVGSTLEIIGEGPGVVETQQVAAADGSGVLKQFVAQVIGPEDENGVDYPLNGVQVEILSTWDGAYVVAQGAVKTVNDFEERCDDLAAEGAVEAECAVWYNVEDETYYEFAGEYENVEEFRPTYMSGVTDARGLMPFYVFVDSVALDEDGEPLDFNIYGTIGVADATYPMVWAD